jgi:hypothetical protein
MQMPPSVGKGTTLAFTLSDCPRTEKLHDCFIQQQQQRLVCLTATPRACPEISAET